MNELALFDSLFNGTMGGMMNGLGGRPGAIPTVDVKEAGDAYTLEMELPGRSENDVSIELDHNTLTISSKTEEEKSSKEEKPEKDGKEKSKYLIRERRVSSFRRSFTLPDDVNEEAVNASFKNGILTVAMPRKAPATPKRIAIKADQTA